MWQYHILMDNTRMHSFQLSKPQWYNEPNKLIRHWFTLYGTLFSQPWFWLSNANISPQLTCVLCLCIMEDSWDMKDMDGRHNRDICLPFFFPHPNFNFHFHFHLLLLLFTLLLCALLVPLRQLLADPPVPKQPAADSYLRDFLFTTSHWGVSKQFSNESKLYKWWF